MLKTIIFLAMTAAFAVAKPAERILEGTITEALINYLTPLDPLSLAAITDLNLVTDHSNILYSSMDNVFSGFSAVECTSFSPPIPPLSKHVTITLIFESLEAQSPSYTMDGTFQGEAYTASGVGALAVTGGELTLDFEEESYSLTDPVSFCVQAGSFNLNIAADTVVANFEGADAINEDINNNASDLIQQLEDQLNAKSGDIEAAINAATCKAI